MANKALHFTSLIAPKKRVYDSLGKKRATMHYKDQIMR